MIYTLTANPAIDLNLSIKELHTSKVNRAFEPVYSPNGKGLNVSFVLKHFGMQSKILGFFGDFSGKFVVEESKYKGIEVLPVWVEDTTRINIFLNECSSNQEYKLLLPGARVGYKQKEAMLELIKRADDMDYLIISGSLPPGISDDFYEEILTICEEKNTQVVFDINSPKLRELLNYHPLLIKPNDEEIESVFGIIMRDEEDKKDVLNYLIELGAQNVLLTCGEKGAYFSNGREMYYVTPQSIVLKSSACAGDAFLAAFLSVWLENPEKIEEALKIASAAGANVAESDALGTFNNIKKYYQNIQVRKI